MKREKAIKIMKVHRTHCRNVGDKDYADALDYAIKNLKPKKSDNSRKTQSDKLRKCQTIGCTNNVVEVNFYCSIHQI